MAITEKWLAMLQRKAEERESEQEPVVGPGDEFYATSEQPGSAEKVEVLADRAGRGWPLWHVGDLTVGNVKGGM